MIPLNDPRLISLAAFFKRHSPGLRHWPREALLAMLRWYWLDGRVGIIRDHGKIVAASTARLVNAASEGRDAWHHDEQGQMVWIEDIASRHPQGIAALLGIAVQRFGPRQTFAGAAFRRHGELRMIPWKTVERLCNQL